MILAVLLYLQMIFHLIKNLLMMGFQEKYYNDFPGGKQYIILGRTFNFLGSVIIKWYLLISSDLKRDRCVEYVLRSSHSCACFLFSSKAKLVILGNACAVDIAAARNSRCRIACAYGIAVG